MSIYLKWALGLITIFSPFIIGSYCIARNQAKSDRLKGCTCGHYPWSCIDPNCPIHRPFYLLKHKSIEGCAVYTRIYASFGERIPICNFCLNEIIPQNYICNWPVENNFCNICGEVCECKNIPERDIKLWKGNK